jgi:hypothetical protein
VKDPLKPGAGILGVGRAITPAKVHRPTLAQPQTLQPGKPDISKMTRGKRLAAAIRDAKKIRG